MATCDEGSCTGVTTGSRIVVAATLLVVAFSCIAVSPLAAQARGAADSVARRGVDTAASLPETAQAAQSARSARGERWNEPNVLELVERGRQRRMAPLMDDALRNYRALAEGSIYFYIDPDFADPVLMRADQVAVELYWAPPDLTRQVLLGQRMEKRLPIRDFHYYIDRLTVVQNGFGDEIQVGEGMDVRNVVHPLAGAGAHHYDYRLADSLVLRLPGSDPIRAYEVVVRPRNAELPGFVGSMYLDGASGALVRMTFGFTRASYVDPRNDYVRITLDHGLWQGRYWLPHEQQVVVRRELPELDLGAGTVIRASLRVTDYDFDLDLPAGFFQWPTVTAAPRAEREAYAFERGMYDDLVRDGLAMGEDVRAIEREARRMLREQVLSGLPRTRPSVPAFSSMFRYNRIEGAFAGSGVRTTAGDADLLVLGGYAFGAGRPSALLQARFDAGVDARVQAMLFHRELRDVAPSAAAPGALNTLAVLAAGRDYLDPFFASGGTLSVQRRLLPGASLRVGAGIEQQVPGTRVVASAPLGGRALRGVFPFAEGTQATLFGELAGAAPAYRGARPSYALRLEGGAFEAGRYGAADATIALAGTGAQLGLSTELRLAGGTLLGAAPLQRHYFLGGPGTLPGHDFRSLIGRRFALAGADATWDVAFPWLGVRAFGAVGTVGGGAATVDTAASGARIRATDGADRAAAEVAATGARVRGTVGMGAAVLHGVLRIDLAHGIGPGGFPTLVFSIDPRLRPWL
jgi:hypothetical protein